VELIVARCLPAGAAEGPLRAWSSPELSGLGLGALVVAEGTVDGVAREGWATQLEAALGLGRIVTLHRRSSAS
jgi:hypothetical protein